MGKKSCVRRSKKIGATGKLVKSIQASFPDVVQNPLLVPIYSRSSRVGKKGDEVGLSAENE